jgi:AcrR family transcriptional regulator
MKSEVVRKRGYRMVARADATAALRERILDVTDELFGSLSDRFSLEDVARGAGTTVQTVLRHFGSKDRVIDAAVRRTSERIRIQRGLAPVGDVTGAVRNLLEHYERYGDRAMRMLAEEVRSPYLGEVTEQGRAMHREWVARTFAPLLEQLRGAARERRLAQLVAICDVYVWKLLRRDLKLGLHQSELALVDLIEALESRP